MTCHKIRDPSQWPHAIATITAQNGSPDQRSIEPPERDYPITGLLDQADEGLIILIRDGELSLFHKFKSQDGALHKFLAILLEELQQRVPHDQITADPD